MKNYSLSKDLKVLRAIELVCNVGMILIASFMITLAIFITTLI